MEGQHEIHNLSKVQTLRDVLLVALSLILLFANLDSFGLPSPKCAELNEKCHLVGWDMSEPAEMMSMMRHFVILNFYFDVTLHLQILIGQI